MREVVMCLWEMVMARWSVRVDVGVGAVEQGLPEEGVGVMGVECRLYNSCDGGIAVAQRQRLQWIGWPVKCDRDSGHHDW